MRRAIRPATCTQVTSRPSRVRSQIALRSLASDALSSAALTKAPGKYQRSRTVPSTGERFECTLKTFMNTLTLSASRLRYGSCARLTSTMRPSAGDSTACGSSGASRGGSRKNCSMNSTSSQKGVDHQPKYQVSAAAAIRVAKTNGQPSRAMIGCGYGGRTRYFCSSSFRRSDPCNATTSSASILRRVDKAVLPDPGHHFAQPRADLLDRQLRSHAPPAEQGGRTGAVLQHELLGVLARLDAQQRIAHALARRFVDDLRAGDVLAVLGVVRDRVVHGADAALVHQVDDQLELVQAFEVRHLGGVARLHQGIESGLYQLDAAAAQHGLLAEQVGLGFLLEVGLDDARLAAADRRGVGQR